MMLWASGSGGLAPLAVACLAFYGAVALPALAQTGDLCDSDGLQLNCLTGCLARDDTLTISPDGMGSVDLLRNDECPPEFFSSIELIEGAEAGVVEISRGHLTFRLIPGVAPTDRLRYRLLDERGNTLAEAMVSLLLPASEPLVARDDTWDGVGDGPVRIEVLENDTVPGDHLPALEIVTPPAAGTLRPSADGRALEFTPPLDFLGSLEARYRLTDRLERQSEATVTLRSSEAPAVPTCPTPVEGWTMVAVPRGTWTAGDDPWLTRLGRSIGATEVRLDTPFCFSAMEVTRRMLSPFVDQLPDAERAPWHDCETMTLSDAQPCLTPGMAQTLLDWLNAEETDGRFLLPDASQWLAALYYLRSGADDDAVPEREIVFRSMIGSLREWTRTPCGDGAGSAASFLVVGLDDMVRKSPDQGALCRLAGIPEGYIGLRLIYIEERG